MDGYLSMKNVFDPLLHWGRYGEIINEMGTKLIGFAPHIAPKAYINVIYAPLKDAGIVELENRLGRGLPVQYKKFLTCSNGLMIFSGSMRVFGLVPLSRTADIHIYNYPSNVIVPNESARIKGITDSDFVVGYYAEDGSYAVIDGNGGVFRILPQSNDIDKEKWASFNDWLSSEILRLDKSYTENNAAHFN